MAGIKTSAVRRGETQEQEVLELFRRLAPDQRQATLELLRAVAGGDRLHILLD
jgi:hypothetical protein